jgi:FkbH-like protein
MRLSYAQIHHALNAERLSDLPGLDIAVLHNIVVEPIEPYLRYFAYAMGYNARCRFGAYDNVFQEATAGKSELLNERTDCVLVFTRLETLSWDLARNFASLDADRIRGEKERIRDFIVATLRGIRAQTPAMIIWCSFEQPIDPALGILDFQQETGQSATVAELNRYLREALQTHKSAYVLDINSCIARLGAHAFHDRRYWHIGKAPYTREGLEQIGSEAFKFIRALKGKNRKCLVLDCDNVLWGGIVGEDGLSGIRLATTYPGSAYYEFQQEVLNLHKRGVVLALCSRNNENDVWQVFEEHPDMLLRKEHIAAAEINWNDKVTNLQSIAATLNLGLDSLVFVDDSEFEAGQVREMLPQVEVVQLPSDRAVESRDILAAGGWFDTLALSQEDRHRGAMYRAEAARRESLPQGNDLTAYYESLEMVLAVALVDAFSVPRVAQLTQKTNQFNLTTHRYSEAQIQEFADSDDIDVIHLHAQDRFGAFGLTGVCILKYVGKRALIDTFLLSCRVLGRGIEDAFLVQCLHRATHRGCDVAVGMFRPTGKNQQVEDFYPKRAFRQVRAEGDVLHFELGLTDFAAREPTHFKSVESPFGTTASTASA